MDEAKREARRKLLAEIEGSWDSPKPGAVTAEPVQPPTAEMQAVLDAAADRLVESLDPPPISVPSLDELDSGWEEEDEEDEEEEPEPELPDEKLDPVAYAAAKKARDERMDARRERKRLKAEAKKARRRARAEAAKLKQKGKTKKARSPAVAQAAKVAKATARAEAVAKSRRAKAAAGEEDDEIATDAADDDVEAAAVPSRGRAKAPPSRPMAKPSMLSGTNTWMLAIAVLVFIAAAIFVAVVTR
jgi:hypothetical protein